jgi:hypothetical protein
MFCLNNKRKETSNGSVSETWEEFLLDVSGIDLMKCPFCEKGRMFTREILLPERCKAPPQRNCNQP